MLEILFEISNIASELAFTTISLDQIKRPSVTTTVNEKSFELHTSMPVRVELQGI